MNKQLCPRCMNTSFEWSEGSQTYIPCKEGCISDTLDETEAEEDLDDEIDHWDEEDQEDLFFPDDEDLD